MGRGPVLYDVMHASVGHDSFHVSVAAHMK